MASLAAALTTWIVLESIYTPVQSPRELADVAPRQNASAPISVAPMPSIASAPEKAAPVPAADSDLKALVSDPKAPVPLAPPDPVSIAAVAPTGLGAARTAPAPRLELAPKPRLVRSHPYRRPLRRLPSIVWHWVPGETASWEDEAPPPQIFREGHSHG